MPPQYSMSAVAQLTGLSPHVIRIWEKRYSAITPIRTQSNRRVFTEADVDRLQMLAAATGSGHKISLIAQCDAEELRRLVARLTAERAAVGGPSNPTGTTETPTSTGDVGSRRGVNGEGGMSAPRAHLLEESLEAVREFDADRMRSLLDQGAIRHGQNGVLHRLICPLSKEIGCLWRRGELTAAHEHFASAVLRDFMARAGGPFARSAGAPCALVATPAGQLHELGAVMAAAAASNLGWDVVYLGASLPAAEIAGAAVQRAVRTVLLSIVYPADDPKLPGELRQLRCLLPAGVALVAGGRAAAAYGEVLREIGALTPAGIPELLDVLECLRSGPDES